MARSFIFWKDGVVDRDGDVININGIDLSAFQKSPKMFFNHNLYSRDDDGSKIIGRWENIRIEGDLLLGDPVFDEKDPYAAEIKRKCDENMLNTCSIGFIKAVRDPSIPFLEGQVWPTIVSCELIEVSIVDMPANSECVSIKSMSPQLQKSKTQNTIPMEAKFKNIVLAIAAMLACAEDDVQAKTRELFEDQKALRAKLKSFHQATIKQYEDAGVITSKNKKLFEEQFERNPEEAIEMLEEIKAMKDTPHGNPQPGPATGVNTTPQYGKRVTDKVSQAQAAASNTKSEKLDKSFDWLQKNDPAELKRIKLQDPDEYDRLVNEHLEVK